MIKQYQLIIKEKPKGFLTTIFKMCGIDKVKQTPYQYDFYNKETDTISSYIIKDKVEQTNKDVKRFKQNNKELKPININKIKYKFKDLNTKETLDQYNETITKVIILLQETTWNISYITKSLNLINIKIDATNNKILKHSKESILSFQTN